jgi:hypothetical protein
MDNVVAFVVMLVAILLAVCIAASMQLRQRLNPSPGSSTSPSPSPMYRATERFTSPFALTEVQERGLAYSAIRTVKNQSYFDTGLKHFFSDGTVALLSNAMYFTPSVNDAACTIFLSNVKDELQCNTRDHIVRAATRDTTTMFHPEYDCTEGSASASMSATDLRDSIVRIFNSFYAFNKTCLMLTCNTSRTSPTQIALSPTHHSTAVFVMLRPLYILYGKTIVSIDYGAPAVTGAEVQDFRSYDSANNKVVVVPIQNITDRTVLGPLMNGSGATLSQTITSKSQGVWGASDWMIGDDTTLASAVVFYMKFHQHHANPATVSVGSTNAVRHNTVTMYFHGNSLALPSARSLFTSTTPVAATVSIAAAAGSSPVSWNVTASVGAKTISVPLPPSSGIVIVTYAYNMLLMASISSDRVVLKREGGLPPLALTPEEVAAVAAQAGAPQTVFPYDNVSIPNFCDIALNYGYGPNWY